MFRTFDRKPDNVLVSADGRCKVADLGLARSHSEFNVDAIASIGQRTREVREEENLTWSDVGGTPAYMSPRVIAEYVNTVGAPPPRPERQRSNSDVGAPQRRNKSGSSGRRPWVTVAEVVDTHIDDGGGGGGGGEGGFMDAYREAEHAREQDINRPTLKGRRPRNIWHAPDAYAMGIILHEVLTLSPPWKGLSRRDMWARVQHGVRPPISEADEAAAPTGYVALMKELWAHDPRVRPMFSETLTRLKRISRPVFARAAAGLPRSINGKPKSMPMLRRGNLSSYVMR